MSNNYIKLFCQVANSLEFQLKMQRVKLKIEGETSDEKYFFKKVVALQPF